MRFMLAFICTLLLIGGPDPTSAKVDLVTLPKRDTVTLTIYNSADLTLVSEERALTLKKGLNRLQFSWANTLIDPTSLDILPKKQADQIDILDLAFPPRVKNLGLWQVESRLSGKVPVNITYLTSGLTWRAFYMGTLGRDEKTMRLQGYVRVNNNSGEDYENARVRMIVGKINLIEKIADLARRRYPYGRPGPRPEVMKAEEADMAPSMAEAKRQFVGVVKAMAPRPKEIKKEGLSEYFLYTIQGTETIPHGWAKRLPSFDVSAVPVVNLYKYEKERYGEKAVRFLRFMNNKEHDLGATPIPGGSIQIVRNVGESDQLAFEGRSSFKYIPVGEDVELNLGPAANVLVEAKLMDFKSDQYLFNDKGNITGWDEIRDIEISVKNTRDIPIKIEITRNFKSHAWEMQTKGDFGQYEKVDLDTVKFNLDLRAGETKKFSYVLTTHHGQRAH